MNSLVLLVVFVGGLIVGVMSVVVILRSVFPWFQLVALMSRGQITSLPTSTRARRSKP